MIVVVVLIALSAPHLTLAHLEKSHHAIRRSWVAFVDVILALSGVEAIANLTGVLKLDPGSTPQQPKVGREAFKAILPVAIEVCIGTALLGWAMLSLPPTLKPAMDQNHEQMLKFLAEQYGTMSVRSRVWQGARLCSRHHHWRASLERGQYRHRRHHRTALHAGPRRRDASAIQPPE